MNRPDQDLFKVGCVGTILQMLRLPDQTVKILVEGKERVDVSAVREVDGYLTASVSPRPMKESDPAETEALRRATIESFTAYAKLNPKIPEDLARSVNQTTDATRLARYRGAAAPGCGGPRSRSCSSLMT